jgi:hypothetical protein
MNQQNQNSLKEMLEIVKGDYNFPIKLWVWGKVIKEWAGLLMGGALFLSVILFFVYCMHMARLEHENKNKSQQTATLPLKDIVAFLAICQRSINKRQEIFEKLMKAKASYENREMGQASLESKVSILSSITDLCNIKRRRVMNEFTQAKNPFEDPNVSSIFPDFCQIL